MVGPGRRIVCAGRGLDVIAVISREPIWSVAFFFFSMNLLD